MLLAVPVYRLPVECVDYIKSGTITLKRSGLKVDLPSSSKLEMGPPTSNDLIKQNLLIGVPNHFWFLVNSTYSHSHKLK